MFPRALNPNSLRKTAILAFFIIALLYFLASFSDSQLLQVATSPNAPSLSPQAKEAFVRQELDNEVDGVHDLERQYT